MQISVKPLLIFALWFVALRPPASYAGEIQPLPTETGSGISGSIEGWIAFSWSVNDYQDAGLLPIVLTIKNDTTVDRVWTIDRERSYSHSDAAGIASVGQLAVPAGQVGKKIFYLDPGPQDSGGHLSLTVRGYGITGGSCGLYVRAWDTRTIRGSGGLPIFPAALSKNAFNSGLNEQGNYHIPATQGLDLTKAPEDWRGWSSLGSLFLDESEWLALTASQRKAFLEWLALGGKAGLLVRDATDEHLDRIGLPTADFDARRLLGAGEIVPIEWNRVLDSEKLDSFLKKQALNSTSKLLLDYSSRDPGTKVESFKGGFSKIFDLFGTRQPPLVTLLCFVAIFGLVAGPINVLVLAGRNRRSRLIFTTPLISLIATIVLLGIIFLRDGIGGDGTRRVLCMLMPDQNEIAIIQEQFSRTGVIFSDSFPIREPSWMRPVGGECNDYYANLLEVEGLEREGDWFSSRSDQAYVLETVRPSRAKVEVVSTSDSQPAVISSIEVPLEQLFLIDESGNYWTASDIGTGELKPLKKSDREAYLMWFTELTSDAGFVRAAATESTQDRRGYVYAETSMAQKFCVESHSSIRWRNDKAIFVGPFTRTQTP